MSLIKVENLSSIETEVINRPFGVHPTEWLTNIQKYTGSTVHDAILKWLALIKYTSTEPFSSSFKIDGVLNVDFNAARYKDELVHIVNGLIKRGQYKKYAGVWNWIPEIQEMVLSTDWKNKDIKKAKSKTLVGVSRLRAKPSYNSLEQSLRRAAISSVGTLSSNWKTITVSRSSPTISDATLDSFHSYFISSARDMSSGAPSIRRVNPINYMPTSEIDNSDDAIRDAYENSLPS